MTDPQRRLVRDTYSRAFGARIDPASHQFLAETRPEGPLAVLGYTRAGAGQGPGRNRMFLRGIADSPFNGESQSTVAVVLDESRVTFSAPDPDLRLVDVERVEVLKGPQGSHYGSGALGGIYRIVTRKPELGETSLTISSGGQVMAAGNTGYSLAAVANLLIARDSAAIRLVGYSGYDAGWIDSGPRDDSNGTRTLGVRSSLRVALGEVWEAEAGGMIQMLDSQDTQYVYAPRERRRPAQLAEPHDNDLTHGVLRLTGRIGGAKIVASSGYTTHEIGDTFDATIGAGQFGLANPRLLSDKRAFRVWDSELRLSGRWGGAEWLLGAAHLEARQTLRTSLDSFTEAGERLLDDDRRTNADTALFGDISLPLTASLRLDAGGAAVRQHLARKPGDGDRTGRAALHQARAHPGARPLVEPAQRPAGVSALWFDVPPGRRGYCREWRS